MAIQSINKQKSQNHSYKTFGYIPFVIIFLCNLFITSSLSAESKIPKVIHSVKPLDLTRTPTTKELMAAGQLGGQLYPTEDIEIEGIEGVALETGALEKIKHNKDINISFGKAIQEWNKHEYKKAVEMFRKHAEDFPDSPWVDESLLHVGCDARYNGRYTEAEDMFQQIIKRNKESKHFGATMLRSKAKSRLAILKMLQGNFDESKKLFSELKKDSPDWRHRTYASHWIQRMSRYKSNELALLNCGTEALALLLKKDGREADAREIMNIIPSSLKGHSIKDLTFIAEEYGYNVKGLKLAKSDLQSIPLPAIVQIDAKNAGDRGHYWVLEKVDDDGLMLFDSQSGRRFHQNPEELSREWNGNIIVFSDDKNLPGILLTENEMKRFYGACCGIQRLPDNTGDPGENAAKPDNQGCPDGYGFPTWKVNMVSMNLYVTDIPLWYDPPIGPDVKIQLSYNSQSSVIQYEPFGNKWSFNYGSYLVEDTGGNIAIFMPDGRNDVYTPDGGGGYTKPFGIFNTLTKIAENHFELEFLNGTVYVYNIPSGTSSLQPFLVEIRDAYGQKLTFGYNANVLIETITDALGKVTTLVDSNSDGLIERVDDPFGRSAHFEYDANNNLTKITDMGGYWAELMYDNDVNLTEIENERGSWDFLIEPSDGIDISSRYPPPNASIMRENYRITITDPLGGREEYYYSDDNSNSRYISPRDYVHYINPVVNNYFLAPKTLYSLSDLEDGEGKIATTHSPEDVITIYGYDDITGKRKFITDLHGHSNSSNFNSNGLITYYSDPGGKYYATFQYYPNNIDVWQIRLDLSATPVNDDILLKTFTYNGTTHDIATITDRLGNITELNYNLYGQITSIVQAKNSSIEMTTAMVYDAVTHELTDIKKSGNIVASYTYDNVGRIETYTDDKGITLTYEYNDLNQIKKITYPDTKFEIFAYSSCCPRMLDSSTDRAGLTTNYIYNALKRLIEIQGPKGVIKYEYDSNGNRIRIIDPDGKETLYEYDLDNRIVKKIYPDGKYIEYAYDTSNLLTRITNSRGIEINYPAFDGNHNLLTIDYSDSTPDVTYTFDDYNRLETMTDGIGLYDYGYDDLNRLQSIDGPWNNDTVTFQYNELGDIRYLTPQGGSAITYNYDYDAGYTELDIGRLKNIQAASNTYTYGYTGVDPLIESLTRPNESATLYQYNDPLKRLTSIDNQDSTAQTINKHVFAYNNLDVIDTETVTTGTTLDAFNAGLRTYSYNNLNQLLSSTNPAKTFDHDDDGNMTQGYTPEGHQFTAVYDAENRLTTVEYNDGMNDYETRYFYSGNGFLAKQEKWDDTVLTGTLEKKDEARFIRAWFLAVQERDDTNAVTKEYTWGLNMGGGIGGLLNLNQAGQDYDYLFDGKGNLTVLTDSSESIAASYRYDAFGKPIKKAGTLEQPYQFSTKRYDESTGLSYYGYRFYNPAISKWMTRDPLGEVGGINLYGFVGNNPVNFIDPYGLNPWGSIFSRGTSKGILSGGPGALTGGIAGAFIGAGLAGPGGAVIGGAVGGHLGGQFDFPSEGQLNYGEDEMLRDWYRNNGNEDSCNK